MPSWGLTATGAFYLLTTLYPLLTPIHYLPPVAVIYSLALRLNEKC